MTIQELEKMWSAFNLAVIENGTIKYPFYNWAQETPIIEILYWFHSNLPDVIYDNKFAIPLLEIMWEQFGNIPTNNDDEIELDFYCWEKGTDRFEIWHWFDEKLPNGLVKDFNLG